MKSFAKPNRWLLVTVVGGFIAGWGAHHVEAQRRTPLSMIRLYTGTDGKTHAANTEVAMMPLSTLGGLEASETFRASGAQFVRWPPGFVREWHAAERRQYVVPLTGQGEVEISGGKKIPLNPGQIVLAEDVTGQGHITRSTGSQDLVLLLVPLATQ